MGSLLCWREVGWGWPYGVKPYLFFFPRYYSLVLITLIYKFQPEIITVAGHIPSNFFQSLSSPGQVQCNHSMHKWANFSFLSSLLLLVSNIGKINKFISFIKSSEPRLVIFSFISLYNAVVYSLLYSSFLVYYVGYESLNLVIFIKLWLKVGYKGFHT